MTPANTVELSVMPMMLLPGARVASPCRGPDHRLGKPETTAAGDRSVSAGSSLNQTPPGYPLTPAPGPGPYHDPYPPSPGLEMPRVSKPHLGRRVLRVEPGGRSRVRGGGRRAGAARWPGAASGWSTAAATSG